MSALAHADPAAEKVFQDGKALLAQGQIAEACEAFRRSQALESRVGTLLNLGDCEEQRGRVATAWAAFVDARALATRSNDGRAAVADQRAAALAPKLPYLHLEAAVLPPEGFVVRRNGTPIAAAELGLEVPLDPGHYELEASAPGFMPWKQSLELVLGQHAALVIPALVVDPNAPAAKPAAAGGIPPVAIITHRVGLGLAIGMSSDNDLIGGIRFPLHLAAVGDATIRAVPSLFYSRLSFADPYHKAELYAVGFAVEYVAPLAPSFVIATGIGFGLDLISDSYIEGLIKNGWGAARFSPTLRLGRSVDVGLHVQIVATSSAIVGLGELGVDYFFW